MASTLRFSVEVAADQATRSLQVLSQSFNQAGISAKSALLGVGSNAKAANDAISPFEQRVRSLKGEMASGDRTINFFARSLNSIVPEASAAGQGLRLLADGLIGGVGLGFALQGVMALLTLFGDHLKEASEKERQAAEASKKYAAERLKAYQETDREVRKLQFIAAGGTAAGFDAQERDKGNLGALAKARGDLAKAQADFAAHWGETVPEQGTMQAKAYADELARIAALLKTVADEETNAAGGVLIGVAGMEGAVGRATETVKAHGDAAEQAMEQVQGLTAAAMGLDAVVGFSGNGSSSWMPEGTGMLTAGAAGNQFLASSQKGFDEKAKRESEAEQAAKAQAAAAQAMAADIASSWISALDQMLGATKVSAQSIAKVFAQLAAQMMTQAGFAWAGPIGGLLGLAANFLPSAAGGWGNVPNDTLAQIHKREMVLPEGEADVIRSLARSGGGGQAPTPVTIVAMDGPSLKDFLVRNGTDFNSAMRELGRQNR
jgi:hypothetical protein